MAHLSVTEREYIASLLNQGINLNRIAQYLQRDRKTIADEIKRNRTLVLKGTYGRPLVFCQKAFLKTCKKTKLCLSCRYPKKKGCWACSLCHEHCSDFLKVSCPRLEKSPFCCNGCPKIACPIPRYIYSPSIAQQESIQRKSLARQGSSLSKKDLEHMQKLLQEGSQKGQSFHHIYQANKEDMLCSERYLYTLKEQGLITVDPFTLPRTLQRKQAKKKRRAHKVDPACRKGRTYKDYTSFLHNNPGLFTVEMDTVEGVREDSKCFLSLAWKAIQRVI